MWALRGGALSRGVGFWNSTGIASDVGDVKTATEAEACVVTVSSAMQAGPRQKPSHWWRAGQSAGQNEVSNTTSLVYGTKMQTPFVSRTSMRAGVTGTVSP
jgi:hypothetical protein